MNEPKTTPDPREQELFIQALERPSAPERAAFLAAACGHDVALKGRVEALLGPSFPAVLPETS